MTIIAFMAAAAQVASTPGPSRGPTGEWRVVTPVGCMVVRDDDVSRRFALSFGDDGRAMISVTHPGLRNAGDDLRLRYVFDGNVAASTGSYGAWRVGPEIYSARLDPDEAAEFARHFAAAAELRIEAPGGESATFSLRGSAAALRVARRCLAARRANRPASTVPGVYPAPSPPAPPGPPAPYAPVSRPGPRNAVLRSGSISFDDYPVEALRARAQGTVTVRYTVGPDGRVVSCVLTGSSGDAALDSTTCILIQRRFRFYPAIDANGNPTSETRTQRVVWRLPVEPAPEPEAPSGELHPARIWLQLGAGDRGELDRQLSILRGRVPALLGRRAAYAAGDAAAARLLVGPFPTLAEAQAFAAELAARRVSASPWTSGEGERVVPTGDPPLD
jgi:TonB family protein